MMLLAGASASLSLPVLRPCVRPRLRGGWAAPAGTAPRHGPEHLCGSVRVSKPPSVRTLQTGQPLSPSPSATLCAGKDTTALISTKHAISAFNLVRAHAWPVPGSTTA
eukprot:104629-Rhodomonas_salina.1